MLSLLDALKIEVETKQFVSSIPEIALIDEQLQKIDVLIVFSESNFQDTRDLISRFMATVKDNRDITMKEIWVFIDEQKIDGKLLSTVVSDVRQSAKCRIRKIILTASQTNNDQIAKQIMHYVKQDRRTIILGPLPLRFIYIVREILNGTIWKWLKKLGELDQVESIRF